MKVKFTIWGLLLLLLFSCKEVQQPDGNFLIKEASIEAYESNKLSEIVEDFELIPLETRDDCLVGRISTIKKRCGHYYIYSQSTSTLLVFNEKGKFVAKIGNKGQGPGEYPLIEDFDADKEWVYILASEKILVYKTNGKFLREIPVVNVKSGKFRRVKNGFLVASRTSLADGNVLAYINDEGQFIKTALPFESYVISGHRISWVKWKENIYIHQISESNDLYAFDADSEEFYEMKLAKGNAYPSAKEFIEKKKAKEIFKVASELTTSHTHLLWGELKGRENASIFVQSKKNGKTRFFPMLENARAAIEDDITFPESAKEMMMLGSLVRNDSDDDSFTCYIDYFMIKEKAEEKGLLSTVPYNKLKDLPDDSNPVLVSLKFR